MFDRAEHLCLRPRSASCRASSVRERTPSLPKTRERWPSTVRSERKSAAATSLFVLPSATRAAIRDSAGVKRSRRGSAAADAAQLGARPLGPERGAEPFERRERLLERLARLATALRTPLRRAERDEGSRVLEGRVVRRRERGRSLELGYRATDVVARAGEQAAATAGGGEASPPARRSAAAWYPSSAPLASSRRPASRSASIPSGEKRQRAGLLDRLASVVVAERLEPLERAGGVAAREREVAERPGREDPGRDPARRAGQLERERSGARDVVLPAEVGLGDRANRDQVGEERALARLFRDRASQLRLMERALEPPSSAQRSARASPGRTAASSRRPVEAARAAISS